MEQPETKKIMLDPPQDITPQMVSSDPITKDHSPMRDQSDIDLAAPTP